MLMTLMMMIALSRFSLTHDAVDVDDSLIMMIVDDIDDAACIVEVYLNRCC